MKQTVRKVVSVIALFFVFTTATSAPVAAQEIDLVSVLNSILDANSTIHSSQGDATVNLSVSDQSGELAGMDLTGSFAYNVEPRFSAEMTLDGQVRQQEVLLDEEGETEETTVVETPVEVSLTMVEGILYAFSNGTWSVEDISEDEYEASEAIYDAMGQAQSAEVTATEQDAQFYQTYFDITQAENEIIFTLKEDINAEQFWADVNNYVDFESLKQQAIDEALAQLEEQGTEVTDSDRELYEGIYDRAFELVLDLIDRLEVRFNAENYLLTHLTLNVSMDESYVAALMGISEDYLAELELDIMSNIVLNFTGHGEQFEITVPEDAPTFDENAQESSETSVEESSN